MVFSPITDKKATHMLIKENASHINDKCTTWILSDPWILSYNNILISSEVVVRGEMCWEERGKLNKISIKILAFLSVSSYI